MRGRDFVHPFMSALDANGSANVIAAAGVLLAITANGGDGPVSVTVEDFRIFGPSDVGLLGMLAEVSFWPAPVKQLLGEVRSRLTDGSFPGQHGGWRDRDFNNCSSRGARHRVTLRPLAAPSRAGVGRVPLGAARESR